MNSLELTLYCLKFDYQYLPFYEVNHEGIFSLLF